jgi:hypothetical protein
MNLPLNAIQYEQNKEAFFNLHIPQEQQFELSQKAFEDAMVILKEAACMQDVKNLSQFLYHLIFQEKTLSLYSASFWLDKLIQEVATQLKGQKSNSIGLESVMKNYLPSVSEESIYILLFGLNNLNVPKSFSPGHSKLESLINNPFKLFYFQFILSNLKQTIFIQPNFEKLEDKFKQDTKHMQSLFLAQSD